MADPQQDAPAPSPWAVWRRARRLHRGGRSLLAIDQELRNDVAARYARVREERIRQELAGIPVGRLKETTDSRLRLGALEQAGFANVGQLLETPPARLDAVPGVGPQTVREAIAAARRVRAALADAVTVRLDPDRRDRPSTELLTSLRRLDDADRLAGDVREPLERLDGELAGLIDAARPARNRFLMLFRSPRRRHEAREALARLREVLQRDDVISAEEAVGTALPRLRRLGGRGPRRAAAREVWDDFQQRAPEYYGLLGEVTQLAPDVAASRGFLPQDLAATIEEQPLEAEHRRVQLRGYQAFGAKFALVQRRVIIGDEMGLGKTIQAIATMAHLWSRGERHFLVVCPASVVVNWLREIGDRSTLTAHRLHGDDREVNLRRWAAEGGVAVTTFESLRALELPAQPSPATPLRVALVVVDEAHYVKNPRAQRSVAVNELTRRTDRVLFLTGTPMENRVEEFRNLVRYLQPQLTGAIDGTNGVAGATAFRRTVAPVYLRRNQEDVLTELPGVVAADEWVEFGGRDGAAYRDAVAAGNFMAMRRAAYLPGSVDGSAKLERLVELLEEAAENGRKAVVFSYFLDVLDVVHATVQAGVVPQAFGPLTGATRPDARQDLLDRFSAARGPAVLVSQIQAGGVGLNMQAASVVILAEPQVKPTLEDQAVARCHRMGQVRSVQVHRLLVADSVDQRMLELLATKSRLFDHYARRSELAESSPDAVDVSEGDLARKVVALERERLNLPG